MKNIGTQIYYAFRNLRARKARSLMTMLGIIIGVAGVIIIVSLGAGAQSLVLGQITKLGSNLIGVLPGKSDDSGPPAAVFGVQITTLSLHDVAGMNDKARVPYATAVAPFANGAATVIYGNRSVDTSFTGTTADFPRVQNVPLSYGTFFSDSEGASAANVTVLGWDVYQQLFPNGENPLGKVVKIKQVPLRIVGVMSKQGTVGFQNQDDQLVIPLGIAQKQLLGINYLQFVRIKVDTTEHVKTTIEDIKTVLREEHHIKRVPDDDDFSVRDLADAVKILENITNGLQLFLALMAGISLIVGGIGIMNIMLVTVSERTREIGLRKALGATSAAVRNQFLIESILLTSVGGVIGIMIGSAISYMIALGARYAGYDWAFIISPTAIILAVGVSVLTGVTFGLYPAIKASKLDPIVALRYE
jgi:putative ABC transport system permease protein